MAYHTTLTVNQLRRLSTHCGVDLRAAARWIAGEPTRPLTRARLERGLRELGIASPPPPPTDDSAVG